MDLLEGLNNLEDEGALVACLHEVNTVLALGQADVRVAPFIPTLLRLMTQLSHNPEAVLLAARALNTILDLEARCCAILVSEKGLPVVCGKLLEFKDFEVAEQCLNCLSLLTKQPSARRVAQYKSIIRADGLNACLAFFDFFPQHMQIKALTAVATLSQYVCDGSTEAKCQADAGHVLQVLPALHAALSQSDPQVLRLACTAVARLVQSYSRQSAVGAMAPSPTEEPGAAPAGEAFPSRRRGSRRSEPKPAAAPASRPPAPTPAQWRAAMILHILPEAVTAKLLKMLSGASKLDAGMSALLLRTLANALKACPCMLPGLLENGLIQVIEQRLAADSPESVWGAAPDDDSEGTAAQESGVVPSGEKRSASAGAATAGTAAAAPRQRRSTLLQLRRLEGDLSVTLGLVAAMTPDVPSLDALEAQLLKGDTSADDTACAGKQAAGDGTQRDAAGASAPASSSSSTVDRSSTSVAESKETPPEAHEVAAPPGDLWACPVCTFHNPTSKSSCEMCGQVSPEIQQRAEKAKCKERPSLVSLVAEVAGPLAESIEAQWNNNPHMGERCFLALAHRLLHVGAHSSVSGSREVALRLFAAINFHTRADFLARQRGEESAAFLRRGNSGYGGIVAALQASEICLVQAALQVVLVDLLKVPQGITTVLSREGVLDQLRHLARSGKHRARARRCLESVHVVAGVPREEVHDWNLSCAVCDVPNASIDRLRCVCSRLERLASSGGRPLPDLVVSSTQAGRPRGGAAQGHDSFDLPRPEADELAHVQVELLDDDTNAQTCPPFADADDASAGLPEPFPQRLTPVQQTEPKRRRKRRSMSHPVGSDAAEKDDIAPCGRSLKKRRMFPLHRGSELGSLLFDHQGATADADADAGDGALLGGGNASAELRAQWMQQLQSLRDMLDSSTSITLHEFKSAGLVPALQRTLQDDVGRSVFASVFEQDLCDTSSKLVSQILALLHAEERFQVRLLGPLQELHKPAHFAAEPSGPLLERCDGELRRFAAAALTQFADHDALVLEPGWEARVRQDVLAHDLLLEPLVRGEDVQAEIFKSFSQRMVRGILGAQKVALSAVYQCKEMVPRPGALVRPSVDWRWGEAAGCAVGVVVECCRWSGPAGGHGLLVRWLGAQQANFYRFGAEGAFDVERCEPAFKPASGGAVVSSRRRSSVASDFDEQGFARLAVLFDKGMRVEVLQSPLTWQSAVVLATYTPARDPAVRLMNVRFVPSEAGPPATFWTVMASPRIVPFGAAEQSVSRHAHKVLLDESEAMLKTWGAQQCASWSQATPGALVDVRATGSSCGAAGGRGSLVEWTLCVVLACADEPNVMAPDAASGGDAQFLLVHIVGEEDSTGDAWISRRSHEVAAPLSMTGLDGPGPGTGASATARSRASGAGKKLKALGKKAASSARRSSGGGSGGSGGAGAAGASKFPLTARETMWLLQRTAPIVASQDAAGKQAAGEPLKPGDPVLLPIQLAKRKQTLLAARVMCIAPNDQAHGQEEEVNSNEVELCLSFDGFPNVRRGVTKRQLLRPGAIGKRTKPLGLRELEDQLGSKDAVLVARELLASHRVAWSEQDVAERLLARLQPFAKENHAAALGSAPKRQRKAKAKGPVTSGSRSNQQASASAAPADMLERGDSELDDPDVKDVEATATAAAAAASTAAADNQTSAATQSVLDLFREMSESGRGYGGADFRMASRDIRNRLAMALENERASASRSNAPGAVTKVQTSRVLARPHEAVLMGDMVPDKLPLWAQTTQPSRSARNSGDEPSKDDVALEWLVSNAVEPALFRPSEMVLESIARARDAASDAVLDGVHSADPAAPERGTAGTASWGNGIQLRYRLPMPDAAWASMGKRNFKPGKIVALCGTLCEAPDGTLSVQSHFPSCTVLGAWVGSGAWYYEVVVTRSGLAQIGWASMHYGPNEQKGIGCGDDEHSWAFDGSRRKRWNVEPQAWGQAWRPGDVIGCAVQIDARRRVATMSFSVNGSWEAPMGKAFEEVPFSGPALQPVITLNRSFRCQVLTSAEAGKPNCVRFLPRWAPFRPIELAVPALPESLGEANTREPPSRGRRDMSLSPVNTPGLLLGGGPPTMVRGIDSDVLELLRLVVDVENLRKSQLERSGMHLDEAVGLHSERLTQKFVLQVQDALSVSCNALPTWVWRLATEFKLLIPLEARILLFQVAAFGIGRALLRLSEAQSREDGQGGPSQSAAASRTGRTAPPMPPRDESSELEGDDAEEEAGEDEEDAQVQGQEVVVSSVRQSPVRSSGPGSPSSGPARARLEAPSPLTLGRPSPAPFGSPAPPAFSQGAAAPLATIVRQGSWIMGNVEGVNRRQLGQLRRQKAVVPRERVLEAAMFLLQHKATRKLVLSVEFSGETGHGLGPTLEFYSLVCQELQRKSLRLWRSEEGDAAAEADGAGEPPQFVFHPSGLWPCRLPPPASVSAEEGGAEDGSVGAHRPRQDSSSSSSSSNSSCGEAAPRPPQRSRSRTESSSEVSLEAPVPLEPTHSRARALKLFTFIGRFVGKALQDNRLLDLPFSTPLCKLLLDQELILADVEAIDEAVGRSLAYLQSLATSFAQLEAGGAGGAAGAAARAKIEAAVEDLCLDFTMPGDPSRELVPGGQGMDVTAASLAHYISLVKEQLLVEDVRDQVQAIRDGLCEFVPQHALRLFSPLELQSLLSDGSTAENWQAETIARNINCRHGFDASSPQIRHLVEVLAGLDKADRRRFMQFLTGSPRLPIGGFGELRPRLTVVKKSVAQLPDDHLPSCSTCQVYLKLPAYSTKSVLEARLLQAIREGQGHFALD